MFYKQMQKSYRKCQQIYTIVKHVQKMQHTYQTNDKHIKHNKNNMLYKQMQKSYKTCENIQTIVTHVQTCNKHSKHKTKTSTNEKRTICCTNRCKKHTNNVQKIYKQ